ncbi:MAG TPA: anthrone oxygenase family protein [Dongiaceae bacterium]|nr:anthrone oxygenase family protein [Dongiaceae bacterium]
MIAILLPGLILISAVGSGLIAGVFFAFSSFVMQALGRLPAEQGIAAMQSINITVLNPLFLGSFMGTAVLCLVLIAAALFRWHEPQMICVIAGGALYVVGTVLVTMVFNVPLNESLADISPASAEGAALWSRYLTSWTMWNHLRTGCAALAAVALTAGLLWN